MGILAGNGLNEITTGSNSNNNTTSNWNYSVVNRPSFRVNNKIKEPSNSLKNKTKSHKNLDQNRKLE